MPHAGVNRHIFAFRAGTKHDMLGEMMVSSYPNGIELDTDVHWGVVRVINEPSNYCNCAIIFTRNQSAHEQLNE